MFDIDRGSQFHPNHDPLAIDRLKAALEVQLGLNDAIVIQSSYSGGLHLYFPLEKPIASKAKVGVYGGVYEKPWDYRKAQSSS